MAYIVAVTFLGTEAQWINSFKPLYMSCKDIIEAHFLEIVPEFIIAILKNIIHKLCPTAQSSTVYATHLYYNEIISTV